MLGLWFRVLLVIVTLVHLTLLFQKEARDGMPWGAIDERQRRAQLSESCDTTVGSGLQEAMLTLRCYPREFTGRYAPSSERR